MRALLIVGVLLFTAPVGAIPPEPPWLFAHVDVTTPTYLAGWALNCITGQQPSAVTLTTSDGTVLSAWIVWRLPRPDVAAAYDPWCGPLKPYLGWHLYPHQPLPAGTFTVHISDGLFSGIERLATVP